MTPKNVKVTCKVMEFNKEDKNKRIIHAEDIPNENKPITRKELDEFKQEVFNEIAKTNAEFVNAILELRDLIGKLSIALENRIDSTKINEDDINAIADKVIEKQNTPVEDKKSDGSYNISFKDKKNIDYIGKDKALDNDKIECHKHIEKPNPFIDTKNTEIKNDEKVNKNKEIDEDILKQILYNPVLGNRLSSLNEFFNGILNLLDKNDTKKEE